MLDDRDREFVEALQGLNVSKSAAALITYLANVKEATSREIEIGTGLRQPEVSVGVRTLHEKQMGPQNTRLGRREKGGL